MSKVESVRVFVAVELPDEVRAMLALISEQLRRERGLKVVAPELLHITVKFLGAIPSERLPPVSEAADDAAAGILPFSLLISTLGAFPGQRAPRVLWAGLRDDAGLRTLSTVFERLEDRLGVEGFQRDTRSFSPHLTLARTRDDVGQEGRLAVGALWTRVQRDVDVRGEIPVSEITVMRSDLRPTGPVYTPLHRAVLGSESRQR